MKARWIRRMYPPPEWRPGVILLIGIVIGLGFYMLSIANVASYASDDPKACINCHVMNTEYATWQVSSHAKRASCNDCHVPHNNVFNKYFFTAKDGLYHSYVYTTRTEPEAIIMHEPGQKVVQQNCIRCHDRQLKNPKQSSLMADYDVHRTDRKCWECHREVPHGRTKSLSAASMLGKRSEDGDARMPVWLSKQLEEKENNKATK